MATIPVQVSNQEAVIPSKAYKGDAGYDLSSVEKVVLKPFQRALISTGLSLAIPEGFGGFVVPRSGLAIKQGLSIVNAPGLIDSNYRGEIKVIAINLDAEHDIVINPGDRIAQLVVMSVETIDFVRVESLSGSERGEGGFGSSGVSQN